MYQKIGKYRNARDERTILCARYMALYTRAYGFSEKKKTFSNEMSVEGTWEASSDTQMERRKSNGARLQQYFLCRWYLFILFGFFFPPVFGTAPTRVIDVSAWDRTVTFIILCFKEHGVPFLRSSPLTVVEEVQRGAAFVTVSIFHDKNVFNAIR